jgi:3-oxoacyl-[acyl-carrier-protein] synthase-3
MGMVITAARTAAHTGSGPASAVELATRAARACLADAQVAPSSVGLLINVGVYRESNTFEPALAALVQKEVGINLDYIAAPAPAAGFSFDLMNGACGVLNAVQLGQALLATAATDRLLITAADVHPGGDARRDPDYPYADLAGAFLLERGTDPGAGFGPVSVYTGDGPGDTEGYLDTAAMGRSGRSRITVRRRRGHAERRGRFAAACVGAYAREHGIDLARTRVIGPAPGPGAGPDTGEPHTAAPVLGYLDALTGPRPADCDRLLFVSAGAGPSAVCAAYRPEGW